MVFVWSSKFHKSSSLLNKSWAGRAGVRTPDPISRNLGLEPDRERTSARKWTYCCDAPDASSLIDRTTTLTRPDVVRRLSSPRKVRAREQPSWPRRAGTPARGQGRAAHKRGSPCIEAQYYVAVRDQRGDVCFKIGLCERGRRGDGQGRRRGKRNGVNFGPWKWNTRTPDCAANLTVRASSRSSDLTGSFVVFPHCGLWNLGDELSIFRFPLDGEADKLLLDTFR
ncbi:hypothetical protein DFH07DRAFT_789738 [Mycena maculata]|uniref:Uncharacterized protein n=1 Tax=Mycena maculata TaxID=230809 RepID=A0AAD7KEJ0_9AGAR|nr:hypothetical protein DFH07DRAFT_789738 [Mycena maculata]